MMDRTPKPGELYRHFKNKLYQIVTVATHSETGEKLVIYQALYDDFGIYARPLDMFVSEVDHEKYPDVKQKYRFEKITLKDKPEDMSGKSISLSTNAIAANAPEAVSVQTQACYEPAPDADEGQAPDPRLLEFLDGGSEISKYVQAVSRAMGVKLRQAHGTVSIISDERTSIVLYEENQFYALSGVATKKKTGSQANGDSCSMFQLDDGMYHVCVSDGMGSGKQAQAESTLVVDLLEKLLEAGFSRESALKLMNSAMVISAGEESYSTVDFATIDMYTGELELAKTGAAPSFIKSGKKVSAIENESLPAGVDVWQESKHSKNTLQSGDFLVMVTDGVLEYLHVKDRQGKLMDIIAGVKSDNAGVMAQEILDRVLLDTGGYAMDDMTVVAIGIWEK